MLWTERLLYQLQIRAVAEPIKQHHLHANKIQIQFFLPIQIRLQPVTARFTDKSKTNDNCNIPVLLFHPSPAYGTLTTYSSVQCLQKWVYYSIYEALKLDEVLSKDRQRAQENNKTTQKYTYKVCRAVERVFAVLVSGQQVRSGGHYGIRLQRGGTRLKSTHL